MGICLLFPAPYSLPLRCVFAEALAKVGGDALLDDAAEEPRQRCGNRDQHPEQRREDKARDRDRFERDGDAVSLVETKMHGEDVGDELDPVDDEGGEQKGGGRQRADADQENVDGAGDALAAAAMTALGKMLVVVGAHGRREARDVVTPPGEDVSYYLVDAGSVGCPTIGRKC